jgi:hypothetical protein
VAHDGYGGIKHHADLPNPEYDPDSGDFVSSKFTDMAMPFMAAARIFTLDQYISAVGQFTITRLNDQVKASQIKKDVFSRFGPFTRKWQPDWNMRSIGFMDMKKQHAEKQLKDGELSANRCHIGPDDGDLYLLEESGFDASPDAPAEWADDSDDEYELVRPNKAVAESCTSLKVDRSHPQHAPQTRAEREAHFDQWCEYMKPRIDGINVSRIMSHCQTDAFDPFQATLSYLDSARKKAARDVAQPYARQQSLEDQLFNAAKSYPKEMIVAIEELCTALRQVASGRHLAHPQLHEKRKKIAKAIDAYHARIEEFLRKIFSSHDLLQVAQNVDKTMQNPRYAQDGLPAAKLGIEHPKLVTFVACLRGQLFLGPTPLQAWLPRLTWPKALLDMAVGEAEKDAEAKAKAKADTDAKAEAERKPGADP